MLEKVIFANYKTDTWMGWGWDEATILLPGYTILLIIRQYLIVSTVIKLIQEKCVLLFIAH